MKNFKQKAEKKYKKQKKSTIKKPDWTQQVIYNKKKTKKHTVQI